MGLKVLTEPQVHKVLKVHRVPKDNRDTMVHKAMMVLQDHRVPQAHKGHKDQQETKEHKEVKEI